MEKRLTQCLFMLGLVILLCTLGARPGYAAQFTNAALGYTVTYPDGWSVLVDPDSQSLNLSNFPWEQIKKGMSFPPGGARVAIEMYPPYNAIIRRGDDDDTIFTRLITPSTTVIARTSAASGKPARLVTVLSLIRERVVNTIVHKGARMFFFSLECGTDDPNCPGYEQVLDQVIASVTLIGATPSPASPTP